MKKVAVIKVNKATAKRIKLQIISNFRQRCCGADERALVEEPMVSMSDEEFLEALGTLLIAVTDTSYTISDTRKISDLVFSQLKDHDIPVEYMNTINRLCAA